MNFLLLLQLMVIPTSSPTQMVNKLLGNCVITSNERYIGANNAAGLFINGGAIGMDEGILLTTGLATNAQPPNTTPDISYNNGTVGDADLNNILGSSGRTYNATSLQFDFVAYNPILTFKYVFASEEYPEYVCSQFNDIFAFLVSGSGFVPNTNIALIPSTTTPVAINSVNGGQIGNRGSAPYCVSLTNSAYYIDNPPPSNVTEYDGFTTVLTATITVVPCSTYHIKMVIADVTDFVWDSGVFIQAESFMACDCEDNNICTLDTIIVNGCSAICVHYPINCDDSNPCTVDSGCE